MGTGVSDVLLGVLALGLVAAAVALLRQRSITRRQREMLDRLPQTELTAFDRDLRVTFTGGDSTGLAGAPGDRTAGEPVLAKLPQAQREPLMGHFRAALRGEQRSFEYRSPRTGRDHWVRVVPVADNKGDVTGGLAVALDISDRRTGQPGAMGRRASVTAITDATRELARSVGQSAARSAVCEGARRVADAPFAALLEPDPADAGRLEVTSSLGADLRGLTLALDADATAGAALAFASGQETFLARSPDDEPIPERDFMRRARIRSVLWHPVLRDHEPVGLLAIGWRETIAGVSLRLSSMIELLGAEATVAIGRADMLGELERLARTDELTGLPNRRDWEERLPSELARSTRARKSLCVAMLDLDHFKAYNDERGHQAGDRLLADASQAWLAALRPYDVLARYGGEEFSLLLPDVDVDNAVALVGRLRAATPEGVTCSAGIAEWDGEEDAAALVGRADASLYEAKRAGRDRIEIATRIQS
jgi:diguanylate cyclase (GGDEF)-like protein